MDIGEVRKPQNGVIRHMFRTSVFSLRLSTLPVNHTESLAIRILPQEHDLSLDRLFLFPNQLEIIRRWTTKQGGRILLTGARGGGKTRNMDSRIHIIFQQ